MCICTNYFTPSITVYIISVVLYSAVAILIRRPTAVTNTSLYFYTISPNDGAPKRTLYEKKSKTYFKETK